MTALSAGLVFTLLLTLFACEGESSKPLVNPVADTPPIIMASSPTPLKTTDCDYSSELKPRVRCFKYYTHSKDLGFTLPVIKILPREYLSNGSQDTPILYIPGGPGGGGYTQEVMVQLWLEWLDSSQLKSPIILFDGRGLAKDAAYWKCDAYQLLTQQILTNNWGLALEGKRSIDVLNTCFAKWQAHLQKSSPTNNYTGLQNITGFNTEQYAKDVVSMMSALGYERWNIIADSYGTRLAMAVASQYPKAVNKIILDSPYPAGKGNLADAFNVFTAAYESLFQRFSHVNFEQKFWALYAALKKHPLQVQSEDWTTFTHKEWLLTHDRLALLLYTAMYSSDWYSDIPAAVDGWLGAGNKESQTLLDGFWNFVFDDTFNALIYYATECQDNALTSHADFIKALNGAPKWKALFKDDWSLDICKHSVFKDAKELKPRPWGQPTLIVNGALDPVTPEAYAHTTKALAKQAWLIKNPNTSHSEFILSHCAKKLAFWFFMQPQNVLKGPWPLNELDCQEYKLH